MNAPQVVAAQAAYAAGLCVIPPREDGSKAPIGEWKQYQTELPTRTQMNAWYGGVYPKRGVGVVAGTVSGHVEMVEMEATAITEGYYQTFLERLETADLADVWLRILTGYSESTPKGGFHALLRTEQAAESQKLATRPMTRPEFDASLNDAQRELFEAKPERRLRAFEKATVLLAETKGEGGFTICAPTNGAVHPEGRAWTIISGGFASIATVTCDERDGIYDVLRSLTTNREVPHNSVRQYGYLLSPIEDQSRFDGNSPGDAYNADPHAHTNVVRLMESHGWIVSETVDGVTHMTRPGKTEGTSATVGFYDDPPMLHVFTSSSGDFDADGTYSPFAVYAILEHGGDYSAAARQLVHERQPNAPDRFSDAGDYELESRESGTGLELPAGRRLYQPGDLGGFINPPTSEILIGPIGEWLSLVTPETETSQAALGIGVLTGLGAWLGKQISLTVGRIEHRTNLLGVIVGPSSYSRKGTAGSEARRLIRTIDVDFASDNYASGFGSGESIIDRLRDEETDNEGNVIRGSFDQRIMVDEGEYARVLRASSRQGSILSDILRLAYDGSSKLEHRTVRGGTVVSTNHHVSMFGAITPEELIETFTMLSAVNGAGNRILWAWSNEHKTLPDGGQDIDTLSVAQAIRHSQTGGRILNYERTEAAVEWWRAHYPALRNLEHIPDRIRPIVNRSSDHVQRIALTYAATEPGVTQIDVRHLEAGMAWVNHSIETVHATMGNLVSSEAAGKILVSLRSHPGQASSLTELHAVLSRHYTATQVRSALYDLEHNGLVYAWQGDGSGAGGPKPTMVIATSKTGAGS